MELNCLFIAPAFCMQGQNDLLLSSTSDLLLQLINILNQLLPAALQSVGIKLSTRKKQTCIQL